MKGEHGTQADADQCAISSFRFLCGSETTCDDNEKESQDEHRSEQSKFFADDGEDEVGVLLG